MNPHTKTLVPAAAVLGCSQSPAPSNISPLCYDISSYRPLIERIARRYHIPSSSCLTPADLIQEGYLGLLEGLLHLDLSKADATPDAQTSQAAYLSRYIHKFIIEALHRYRSAVSYPPSHPFDDDALTLSLGKRISSSEEDGEATLADTIPDADSPTPEQLLIHLQDAHILQQVLSTLTPREQIILTRLYGLDDREPATAEALATALAISKWSVHKLRERALRKLQKNPLFMSNFSPKPVYR